MVNKHKIKLNDLRIRWHSLGMCLSEGVRLSHVSPEIKKLIKDTRNFIKTVRYVYDC